jgi:hypothetical protein
MVGSGALLRARVTAATVGDHSTLDVGDYLLLPSADFLTSHARLVIFLSPTCPSCKMNPIFYDAIVAWAHRKGIPAIIVNGEGVSIRTAREQVVRRVSVNPARLGVLLVPTVAVVGRFGRVTSARVGAVEPGREASAVDQFEAGASQVTTELRGVGLDELKSWRIRDPSVQVLDITEPKATEWRAPARATRGGFSIPMPASEVSLRARYELDAHEPVVVDCRSVRTLTCQGAMVNLRQQGFASIRGLGYRPSNVSVVGKFTAWVHLGR